MDKKSMPELPPSAFANMGNPSCSCWGKSEIEWIALAYVRALANDGDTWKRLSRQRAKALLTDAQLEAVHGMLDGDWYDHWFQAVSDRLTDSDGAWRVGGFWNEYRYRQSVSASGEQPK